MRSGPGLGERSCVGSGMKYKELFKLFKSSNSKLKHTSSMFQLLDYTSKTGVKRHSHPCPC
jgi:hypothetical protein